MGAATGLLALVGGSEWTEGCTFDRTLLEASGADEVLVLPTAAAYERPEHRVAAAGEWFESMDVPVRGLMVASRADAQDPDAARVVRRARLVYLADGSPLHLRSVLKGSAVLEALTDAWHDGAAVAGSGAGAMVLTDPMVDPRGGALTVGLGIVRQLAVIPHFGAADADAHGEKLHRSVALAPRDVPVVGVPERTALLRHPDGRWERAGAAPVTVFVDGRRMDEELAALDRR